VRDGNRQQHQAVVLANKDGTNGVTAMNNNEKQLSATINLQGER